jgi:hypothetical protein
LFLRCEIAARIWYEILAWIGQFTPLPPNLNLSFAMFVGFGAGKKGRKGMMLLWHAYIWTLWCVRNNKVFNDGIVDVDEAVIVHSGSLLF